MLTPDHARDLLKPYGVFLDDRQTDQLLTYLGLLLKWNRKINLTAVRDDRECVTRHFGESLMLAAAFPLSGRLLDIGSGAGFPGMAIKIVAPELEVTLLEPVGKKRAFLRETARVCGMKDVDVRSDRLEEFSSDVPFDAITMRAVGRLSGMVNELADLLIADGRFYLWSTSIEGAITEAMRGKFRLDGTKPIPETTRSTITCWAKAGHQP